MSAASLLLALGLLGQTPPTAEVLANHARGGPFRAHVDLGRIQGSRPLSFGGEGAVLEHQSRSAYFGRIEAANFIYRARMEGDQIRIRPLYASSPRAGWAAAPNVVGDGVLVPEPFGVMRIPLDGGAITRLDGELPPYLDAPGTVAVGERAWLTWVFGRPEITVVTRDRISSIPLEDGAQWVAAGRDEAWVATGPLGNIRSQPTKIYRLNLDELRAEEIDGLRSGVNAGLHAADSFAVTGYWTEEGRFEVAFLSRMGARVLSSVEDPDRLRLLFAEAVGDSLHLNLGDGQRRLVLPNGNLVDIDGHPWAESYRNRRRTGFVQPASLEPVEWIWALYRPGGIEPSSTIPLRVETRMVDVAGFDDLDLVLMQPQRPMGVGPFAPARLRRLRPEPAEIELPNFQYHDVRSLHVDGAALWATSAGYLSRVDPVTLRAQAQVQIPLHDGSSRPGLLARSDEWLLYRDRELPVLEGEDPPARLFATDGRTVTTPPELLNPTSAAWDGAQWLVGQADPAEILVGDLAGDWMSAWRESSTEDASRVVELRVEAGWVAAVIERFDGQHKTRALLLGRTVFDLVEVEPANPERPSLAALFLVESEPRTVRVAEAGRTGQLASLARVSSELPERAIEWQGRDVVVEGSSPWMVYEDPESRGCRVDVFHRDGRATNTFIARPNRSCGGGLLGESSFYVPTLGGVTRYTPDGEFDEIRLPAGVSEIYPLGDDFVRTDEASERAFRRVGTVLEEVDLGDILWATSLAARGDGFDYWGLTEAAGWQLFHHDGVTPRVIARVEHPWLQDAGLLRAPIVVGDRGFIPLFDPELGVEPHGFTIAASPGSDTLNQIDAAGCGCRSTRSGAAEGSLALFLTASLAAYGRLRRRGMARAGM